MQNHSISLCEEYSSEGKAVVTKTGLNWKSASVLSNWQVKQRKWRKQTHLLSLPLGNTQHSLHQDIRTFWWVILFLCHDVCKERVWHTNSTPSNSLGNWFSSWEAINLAAVYCEPNRISVWRNGRHILTLISDISLGWLVTCVYTELSESCGMWRVSRPCLSCAD